MSKFTFQRQLLLFGLLSFFLIGCKPKTPKDFQVDKEFQKYINSFTSGVISAASPITINFHDAYEGEIKLNEPIDEKLFQFTPSVKGQTVWLNRYTIQFVPDEPFASGKDYWVDFDLGKIYDVPKDLKQFKFPFTTIKQALNFEVDGLRSYSAEYTEWYQFIGTIYTADIITPEELEKNVEVLVNGNKKAILWEKIGNTNSYELIVDSVPRKEKSGEVVVRWNSLQKDLGQQEVTERIPSLSEFEIMGVRVVQHPEQYVLVRFSDPIEANQNLEGLISIANTSNNKIIVSTNEIRIYPEKRLSGDYIIQIHEGVKNSRGYKFNKFEEIPVNFEAIKPAVRLVGKGTILPSTNNMILPFEAVNLKAIDVRIIKIFENNVFQFFQGNDYAGEDGLRRVGRLVRKKTIYLDKGNPLDLGKWNRFSLDLSEYFKVEQGAIYRVEIGFRKHHSLFPCDETQEEDIQMDEQDWDETDNNTKENWDYYGDWNSDYWDYYWFDGYRYSERENPCSYSYYNDKSVVKNIFASDIGIITKRGTKGENLVVVTDLVSANPISGAKVKIYDFQQQLISEATTDKDGIVQTEASRRNPFFIVASYQNQKGYLRLGNGNSLSMSHFDIDGATTQEGLKGYIYGERGVWRPGDTLFLNFILEDKEQVLPKNHPVIFELFNSRGQLVKREIQNTSLNGFYNFTTTTDASAPTGNWTARVEVGGATFTKSIKIETIKPNRLKINLDLKNDLISGSNPEINGNLTVNWLHGAPAKQLKTDISVKLIPTQTVFKDYKNYHFDDPSKRFYFDEEIFLSKKLNDEGKLSFSEKLKVDDQAPGMLKAIFTTRAFEKGGDFSIDQRAFNYAPYDYFIGIKSPITNSYGALETDTTHRFQFVSVDEHGKKVGNRQLRVKIFKIDWSWWWQSDADNVANYVNNYNVRPIENDITHTNAQGEGFYSTKINKYDWGRYYIQVEDIKSGHSSGIMTYFDWPSWMSRAGRETPEGANMLTFSTDKKEYKPGDKAKISFPSAANSQALISIESGSKVIDAFWIKTQDVETNFELPITPDLAPNCYIYITLLQPHNQTENDAPIRMYGITPILITDPNTVLEPILKMPDELAPNSKFSIEVKEKNNKDMTYTIAVVDEGLLDLTRFKTPNPWKHFYAREALGVKTWDLFDHVIGAYGAKIENILTIGGDENINPGEESPLRFKPMVRFIGPFALKGGKTGKHEIDVPNYIGSVRTMVVAGEKGAYGNAEKTTPVKKPLMLLSTLPRVLGPQEKVQLPVNVFAMDKKVKDVTVQVSTNQLVKIKGESKKQIRFNSEGDQLVTFDLEVGTLTGALKVEIKATGGGESATEIIELEVRQPNLPVTIFNESTVDGDGTWASELNLPGIENSNTAKLELSVIPPINLEKRLGYLTRYPHGCLEQKTSGAFPQLFLKSLIDVDAELKTRIDYNIHHVINKIQRHQVSDGGFSFWEGQRGSDEWATTYAGHFLLEAEKKGYALPFGLKDKWINFQKNKAKNWVSFTQHGYKNSDLAQAYRLYTLALADKPELGAMNKLRLQSNLSIQAAWRLAAAYQILGKDEVAKEIVRNKTTKVQPYTELSYTYGNDTRDKAMIVEALTLMGEKSKAAALVRELSEALSKDTWMSTQTTSYSLLAIALFTENNKPKGGINATFTYNGKTTTVKSTKAIELINLPVKGTQTSAQISVKNSNNEVLFARLIATGIPAAGSEIEKENNLKLDVVYRDLSGKAISVHKIEQGTDFIAEVTVSNPGFRGNYDGLSLSQIFPSGWEIRNQRMDIGYTGEDDVFIDYQDIRDDRVYSYFGLEKNKSKTIRVQLHAAYIGEYYLPAVYIEAMYDATISALKKGQVTRVVGAGK